MNEVEHLQGPETGGGARPGEAVPALAGGTQGPVGESVSLAKNELRAIFPTQSYLFVHVIWAVRNREPLLSRPVRRVLLPHLQREAGEKGMRVVAIGGVEDHIHCLLQLMPSQNLVQVMKSLRMFAADWINESKLLTIQGEFAWEEGFVAYSVSPSGVKQMIDYLGKQEEYHRTKTLDSELEVIDRFKDAL